MLQQTAYAKINLALQITGKHEDGYHQLNSLVCFIKYGDELFLEKLSSGFDLVTLEVTGPFADELGSIEDNLVMKAVHIIAAQMDKLDCPLTPVKIILEKNLPIASGIGGGSADAAAVIRLLKEFWDVPPKIDIDEICLQIGADVPMCLHSKPLIAQGIGETIIPLDLKDEFHIVLVNPSVAISTPNIFRALNFEKDDEIFELDYANLFNADKYDQLRNDLQEVAIRLYPQINKALSAISKTKPFHFGMSGSGATCFGLYETEEAALTALKQISKQYPQYWAIATTTIAS